MLASWCPSFQLSLDLSPVLFRLETATDAWFRDDPATIRFYQEFVTKMDYFLIWRRDDLNFRLIQRSRLIRSFNNSFSKNDHSSRDPRDELQVRVEIIGESCFM